MDLLLNRRTFLIGTAGVGLAFSRTGACLLAPEQEQGPYYVGSETIRKNVAEDRKGVPLKLQVSVVNSTDCTPLRNVAVDIWHCDAEGEYSGYAALVGSGTGPGAGSGAGPGAGPGAGLGAGLGAGPGFGPPPSGPPPEGPPPKMGPTNKKTFLRGVQLTDSSGCAEFLTIYPGWYVGRSIHIHLKVHIAGQPQGGAYTGGHVSHTGQLFFPEDVSETIAALTPYSRHRAPRTLHAEDHVFESQHGQASIVELRRVRDDSIAHGLIATASLGVNPQATPAGLTGRGPTGPRYR